eukprot:gb/GECG01012095.1/.p1 GENE.gb/GECG01012095.1/~~gb/GECG01012095.1/.p1  ORF type:complete len:817 (+),score=144.42 gb/GECG01012095.1/:1-2451(+)
MSQWNSQSLEGGDLEEEDIKNDETFGAAVDPGSGPPHSLPAFFGGESSGAALGGEADDFEALKSAEEYGLGDMSDSLQDDPNANAFNDDTFGDSLEKIPTEGLPGFFGGSSQDNHAQSSHSSSTKGAEKRKETESDESEWKKKQEVFAKFHEEFLREQEVSGITSKEDLSTDEQLASLLNFSIDDDDELLQTAISASSKDNAYIREQPQAPVATGTANAPVAEIARPPQTYADLAKGGMQPQAPHQTAVNAPTMPMATPQVMNNVELLRQQIMQLQLLLTTEPPLAPGLEGCPPSAEEYRRLISQRQEACQKLQQLYMYMQQIDTANRQQGYNVSSVSRQLAFLTSGPHAAVASPPIQAEYIKLFQTGSWKLPKKTHGRFMTSQETRLIASMQGRQLYIAGAKNPGADWYLHMWRARKLQKIAKSYGFESIPEDIVLPKGSVEFIDGSNDPTKLSMVWGNWTKSRLWESFNHVLGRSEKGSLKKPRRLLNLGDEPELPEVSSKTLQESDATNLPRADKEEFYEERRKEAARKEAQTKAAAKMLAGKLTDQDPDKQSLWSARAAISSGLDALVRVRDAANSRSIRLKSSPPPDQQETELMQKQIRDSLSQLVRALGLETNFEFGTDSSNQTNSFSLRDLSTPSEDGLALLMVTISMSKGKKLLCRAVPWLPPGPVAALVTAAMKHLPHFVASAAEGPDAEEADELLSESLAKWISTAVVPQTTDNQDSHTSLDLLIIWIRHLINSHDASILQALLNHPGGAKVFIALLERGKDEANSLQRYAQQGSLEPKKKSQFESSVKEWNNLTEQLASLTQSSG